MTTQPVPAGVAGPGVVHVYSYVTGVSLELPVGFEQVAEDAVHVTYADRDDDRDDHRDDRDDRDGVPVVQVSVVGAFDDDETDARRAAAVRELAEGLAGRGEVLTRAARRVDGEPAETVVVRDADGRVVHQTVAASPVRLVTVLGTVERPDLAAAYDRAVDSIRFVDL